MSEHYEPSYYEIALTGRQVLAGFVILLVCLVAAFFSGVWVGRGGTGVGGGTERVADVEPEAGAPDGEAPAPDGDLEELSFFEGDGGAATEGGRRTGPGSGAEGAGEATEGPRREPSAGAGDGAERSASPGPAAESDRGASGGDSGSPAGTASAEDPPPRPAPPPPPPPPPPSAPPRPNTSLATGDIVVQVFSSAEEDKAREVLERLRANDFRAFLSPTPDGERTLYRVRVGPFEHMDEARAVAGRLRERLGLETWITQ